ncbi:MAG: NYN domain-containing protein [archaeon]|nr:NYN domain-containing protein [archaeon]
MDKKERISIFIDGNNLYHSLNRIKAGKIDYKKLINELVGKRILINVFYYIAPLDITSNEEKYWKHQKFLAELEKIPGFKIVLCTLRKYPKPDGTFGFEVKGDDVYLANDMLVGAYENLYDGAILISGDEDFMPVVNTLKKLSKRVENLYFTSSSSKNLRKTCTGYLNIRNILDKIKLEE